MGFTLMELLVTASIVGILAAVALPNYQRVMERGYWRSAQDMLRVIHAGEQTFQMANNQYVDPSSAAQGWRTIFMDNPNVAVTTLPMTFTVVPDNSVPTNLRFTATATRNGRPGCVMTIQENGAMGNPSPACNP